MARNQGAKLISALEAEARAHRQLVNIGEELKTVYMAGQLPDDDEMLRLQQAYQAFMEAGRSVRAAVYNEQVVATRRRSAAYRKANLCIESPLRS
jgi:hypothetical protein